MANVNFHSTQVLPLSACQSVELCLTTAGAAKTVSGNPTIVATVDNSYRALGPVKSRMWDFNSRGSEKAQYSFTVEDSLIVGGQTLECEDIEGVSTTCLG